MKRILVTGASSGIGAEVARHFLDNGWHVGLMARRRDALERVAQDHENADVLVADVTREGEVKAAFDAFGEIDVLFNNAGTFGVPGCIDEIPLETWHEVVAVNLTGMFLCAREAFARMRAQGGRIINNGSISAHVPRENAVCYTTTKHAITGLTKQLSLDGRALGIACGQIDIGNARTELLEELAARTGVPQPMMQVGDVAKGVMYMASLPPEANVQFMTVMAREMPYIGRG
ncbi:SDR family oxidoreductase [Primorskyibacter sp. S187A]|uniref:SDR family oxidoreductase n=1 Tax=Primorskyibacter sp. S187A TaxID=3415130 RepID=UPI003C79D139